MLFYFLPSFFIVFLLFRVTIESSEHIRKLRHDLLHDYHRDILPVRNQSVPVTVSVGFYLIMLEQLNMKAQIMSTNGYLKLAWIDEFLQWKPADYGGIDEMFLFQNEVWQPDILLENTATHHRELGTRHTLVSVLHTGTVHWEPGVVADTSCVVDITKYPFDAQTCDLSYLTWMRTNWSVILEPENAYVDTADVLPNGEWDITSTGVFEHQYPTTYRTGAVHTVLTFRLELYRKRFFYIPSTLVPVLLLSTLNVLVFILPSDCGERMGLAITLLLAFTVYLSIISENIPETSQHICILTIYLTILLGLSTASVVCAGIVLNVHFRDPDQPVPHCLISFFGSICLDEGKIKLRLRKQSAWSKGTRLSDTERGRTQFDHSEPSHQNHSNHQKTPRTKQFTSETEVEDETKEEAVTAKAADTANSGANKDVPDQVRTQQNDTAGDPATGGLATENETVTVAEEEDPSGAQVIRDKKRSLIGVFAHEMRKLIDHIKKGQDDRDITWYDIACAMDRFFFWVFLIATGSVNIIVLLLLTY